MKMQNRVTLNRQNLISSPPVSNQKKVVHRSSSIKLFVYQCQTPYAPQFNFKLPNPRANTERTPLTILLCKLN